MTKKRHPANRTIRATLALEILKMFSDKYGGTVIGPVHAEKTRAGFITSITLASEHPDQTITAAIERKKSEYIIAIEEATEHAPGAAKTITAKAAMVADHTGHIVISGQSAGHRGALFQRLGADMMHRLAHSALA